MPALLQRAWQKDHVYLVQYPRCRTLPNFSPWSLKMETWLRMTEIPFTNINSEFKKFSAKGQVPFIELNGRQIADSNFIIDALTQEFGKADMDPAEPRERAVARAFAALVEDHLAWCAGAYRLAGAHEFLLSDDGFGRYHGTGVKRTMVQFMMKQWMKKVGAGRLQAQGMGRHTPDEVLAMTNEALKSISIYLGDKPFFGGDRPITLDATMFGHIAGFVYVPDAELNKLVKETYPNIGAFIERIKERFWPDWEETCSTMNMNTHHKKD